MCTSGIEIAQQGGIPPGLGIAEVTDDILDEKFRAAVGVRGTGGTGLRDGDDGRVAVDDNVAYAVVLHGLEQGDGTRDVVVVVVEWDLTGFADGLEPREVDDGPDGEALEDHVQPCTIKDVNLEEGDSGVGDLLDAADSLEGGVP
ncbi:hypothetical protein BC936DRAFT_143570 [Jimgerdemannia flammicorona]|uniref:Uncharacterized protein n=1 Tax=Jimgerdemannia flammicorona TaxID=994334 RepID=A0A432ZZ77_9FUNG|nr:hypothetical protein BC936DRAFT_143570 [Jimgerdemannia flammicorona]